MSDLTKYTFEAWEKDGAGFRRRGTAIKTSNLKKVSKIFGDSVEKLQKSEDEKAFYQLESGVRLQSVWQGFQPLTRKDRNKHILIKCGSCGWWGTSRLVLNIPKKSAACPICHGVKLNPFDVDKEIKILQSIKLSVV